MPTKGAQGRESMELRSPRPQQGKAHPRKDGAGQGGGQTQTPSPNPWQESRVSEQRKSQNCQNQQILPGLETLGVFIKEKLTHTWRSHHLS